MESSPNPATRRAGVTRRVLLILGEGDASSRLRAALESEDFELEIARSASGALRRMLLGAFDALVTSPDSPLAEDVELARYLQRVQPGLKAIVLAAAATPEDVIVALQSHVFACFREPFDPADVVHMVRRALAETEWRDGISVLSASPDWISLRVTPRLLIAERLHTFVDALSPEWGQGSAEMMSALHEILGNVMEQGTGFDDSRTIEVSAVRTARAFVFHVRDPGTGFPLEDLPHAGASNPPDDATSHLAAREARNQRPGGLGILMARKLVDEVIYNQIGNEVILIRYRS